MTTNDLSAVSVELLRRARLGEFDRNPDLLLELLKEGRPQAPASAGSRVQLDTLMSKLAAIWQAYLDNELDDEARRFWGGDAIRHENTTPPDRIEIYAGRGGKKLLTLGDCKAAYDILQCSRATGVYPENVSIHKGGVSDAG